MHPLILFLALTLPTSTCLQGASPAQLETLRNQYTELRDSAAEKEAPAVKEDAEKAIATLDRETTFRTNIALPLCQAEWGIQQAKEAIREEKSNPAGVVNLHTLHITGEALRYFTRVYRGLLPVYAKYRHHAYQGSETEGVCR